MFILAGQVTYMSLCCLVGMGREQLQFCKTHRPSSRGQGVTVLHLPELVLAVPHDFPDIRESIDLDLVLPFPVMEIVPVDRARRTRQG